MTVLLFLVVGCSSPAPEPEIVRPVRTEVVREVGGMLEGVFSGTAEARDAATLSFMTGGTIEVISVGVGDQVVAGQTLARLSATSQALQVEQARAGVAQARAAQTLSQQTLERTETLFVSGSATQADLEGARAQRDTARAQRDSAARQLELAQDQASHSTLKAGRAGEITGVLANERETVGAGTPIVVLTPEQELSVAITVPERWIGKLNTGDLATIRLASPQGEPLSGRVSQVGRSGRGGAFPVTVELLQEHRDVRPGMVAQVTLRAEGDGVTRTEIPLSALSERVSGTYVWTVEDVADGFGRTRSTPITVGELVGANRVVVDGVMAGTVVVTAGAVHLYEDRVVRVEVP